MNKITQTETVNDDLSVPLCVDLDGTLVHTDVLIESLFALLKQSILYLFLLPLWLLKGKAYFKEQIAKRVDLDVNLLPYNTDLLEYLGKKKQKGQSLVLTTATNIKYAKQIASHLGIFDSVLASDANINLSGLQKRQCLIDTFGDKGFDYAGNADIDLEIWTHARKGILVNLEPGVRKKTKGVFVVGKDFGDRIVHLQTYFRAMRLQQWLKNMLVFVPLLLAHQANDAELLLQASLGFLLFGLCASSVYLLNDLLDLPADRRHRTKRMRPLAAGTLPIKHAIFMIFGLLIAAATLALWLPPVFLASLTIYYVMTLAYSLKLKQTLLLDVLVLACLYTMRIIAGAAAVSVVPSFWLLAFSMFLFLSLSLVKRYSEILALGSQEQNIAHGRSYRTVDLGMLAQFGAASGYLAVLVLALYIDSEQVRNLYNHPTLIWLLCPLLLYWISRVWLLAGRGEMHEDPVVFAIDDRRSHWLGLVAVLILWVSI